MPSMVYTVGVATPLSGCVGYAATNVLFLTGALHPCSSGHVIVSQAAPVRRQEFRSAGTE